MFVKETENKPAGRYSFWAFRDARMQSIVNSSRYNEDRKIKAERIRLALGLCVRAEDIYIEYRKKFISVKVHKPGYQNRKDLALLESDWTQEGVTKVVTNQGFTYRIPPSVDTKSAS